MEAILLALAKSLADYGPIWLLAFSFIVMFAWKIWPYIVELSDRREDREDKREQRMAEYQKESAERDGKWLIVSEQSAHAMDAMAKQMEINNTMLRESKERSRGLGEDMKQVKQEVHEIHTIAVNKGFNGQ